MDDRYRTRDVAAHAAMNAMGALERADETAGWSVRGGRLMRDELEMNDCEAGLWAGLLMGVGLAGAVLALVSCTPAQLQRASVAAAGVSAELQAACAQAMPLAQIAAPLPTVGPFIAMGVTAGCGTAEGLAKLAADPASAAWVGEQMQMLKAALGQRG